MTEPYKVSILVPVYGVEKYIERCVRSLFEQTYENIEYIFVNDCTKDKSIEILERVIETFPKRKKQIRIINHCINKGLAASRNTAVNHCSGDFIMHVDSDDHLDPDTVEYAVIEQQKGDYDIVSFGCYREYKNKTIVQNPPDITNAKEMCKFLIEKKTNVGIWGRLYRTTLYKENGICALEGSDMGEDYQITPRLMFYAKSISNLKFPKYHYNLMNENSYVNSINSEKNRQLFLSSKIVFDFFHSRTEFVDSVHVAKLKIGTILMQNCIKGNLGKEDFKKYATLLTSIPLKYYKNLNVAQKVTALIRNYHLLNFAYRAMNFITKNICQH